MKKSIFVIAAFLALSLVSGGYSEERDPEYAKALKHYHMKRFDKAVEILKIYVEVKPEPAAYYLLGYSLYELGKYREAMGYFDAAFLIDPDFSLEKAGLITAPDVKKGKSESLPSSGGREVGVDVPAKPVPKEPRKSQAAPKEAPQTASQVLPAPKAKEAPQAVPQVQPAPKAEQRRIPAAPVQTQPRSLPKAMQSVPLPPDAQALIGKFGILIAALGILFYIYFSLCLYKIAGKLDVSAAWTAWVPLVQIWTIVAAAGKPWWWLLILVLSAIIPFAGPIISGIVSIYLWVCITENLGRNKWLGLLMIVPLVNLVWPGILAFSRAQEIPEVAEPAA